MPNARSQSLAEKAQQAWLAGAAQKFAQMKLEQEQETDKPLSLLDLPKELFLKIIELVCRKPKQYATLALVCKAIARVVTALPAWRKLSPTQKRRALLEAKLSSLGLPLRSDSHLCADYISNGERKLAEVVGTMQEMAWYFSSTNYEQLRFVHDYYDEEYYSDDYEDDDYYYSKSHSRYHGRNRWSRPRAQVDSGMGKMLAQEDWVSKHLENGYYVPSGEIMPLKRRPPPSLQPILDNLMVQKVVPMIQEHISEGKFDSVNLKELFDSLDAKYPGTYDTKFSELAVKLVGEEKLRKMIDLERQKEPSFGGSSGPAQAL